MRSRRPLPSYQLSCWSPAPSSSVACDDDDSSPGSTSTSGSTAADPNGAGIRAVDVDGVGLVLSHDGSWGGFCTWFAPAPDHHVSVAATCVALETWGDLGDLNDAALLLRPWIDA